ncbi:hypothetical protein D9619_007018 [Psilocybe cf. subviscida]|uniref:Uncharacterized protein n=1 Tax=Psilocybe cf. subviscida TaxID=2480587 RepID=A0A8H5EWL8_9AGAR|nr:hypothetical protein D9619_007018 [Psilocybe cf. subviscida]
MDSVMAKPSTWCLGLASNVTHRFLTGTFYPMGATGDDEVVRPPCTPSDSSELISFAVYIGLTEGKTLDNTRKSSEKRAAEWVHRDPNLERIIDS